MIRYRCSHCAALTVAHERRAGQSSVCKVCVKPHQIPADKALWLNELGELLHPPATDNAETVRIISPAPASVEPPPAPPTPAAPPEPVAPAVTPDMLAATTPEIRLPEDLPEFPEPVVVPSVAVRPPEPKPEPKPEPEPPLNRDRGSRTPRIASAPAPEPREAPRPAPAPAPAAVATMTPPPTPAPTTTPPPNRTRPLPVPMPTPAPRVGPKIPAAVAPVQLQTQADIAAALTTALTKRMKPRAAPRRDLRPSTAVWMLLTGIGIALVLVGLFDVAGMRLPALLVGAIEIIIGYAWIVRLTYVRDPQRGILCAIPPITLYYLTQYKYAKLRPLRFFATGAALIVLTFMSAALVPITRAIFHRAGPEVAADVNPATLSKLEQLRYYRDRKAYDPLMSLLEVLAKTDPLLSAEAKDRAELATELKGLCQHIDTGVKIRAMSAYARWDPAGARDVCLAAVRSQSYDERKRALELLPQWRDDGSARAVQSLIGRPGTVETNEAKAALEKIGGPPAEQAAWALLNRADDQATRLTAISILEKVGGANTVNDLRTYAKGSEDQAVSEHALAAAKTIEARLRINGP